MGQFQNRFGRRLDFSNFNFGLFRPQVKPKFEFPLSGFSVLGSNDITTRFSIPGLDNLPVPSDSTSSEKTTEAPLKNVFQLKTKKAMNTFPTKTGVKTRLPTKSTHTAVSKHIPKESGHSIVNRNKAEHIRNEKNEKHQKALTFPFLQEGSLPVSVPPRQVKINPLSDSAVFETSVFGSKQHTTERLPLTTNTAVKRRLPTKSNHRLVSNSPPKELGHTSVSKNKAGQICDENNEKRLKASKFPFLQVKIPRRKVKVDPLSGSTLFIRRVSASKQHTTERLPLTTPYETTENPTTHFKPSNFYNNYSSDYSLLQYDYTSDNTDDFNSYDYDSSPFDYSECPGSLGECLSACSPVASIRQTAYKICVNECLDRCS